MKAFYVHGSDGDWVVIPDVKKAVRVTARQMAAFIGPDPWFESWAGEAVKGAPKDYGTVIATRNDEAPIVAVEPDLWAKRKAFFASQAKGGQAKTAKAAPQKAEKEEWTLDGMDFDKK